MTVSRAVVLPFSSPALRHGTPFTASCLITELFSDVYKVINAEFIKSISKVMPEYLADCNNMNERRYGRIPFINIRGDIAVLRFGRFIGLISIVYVPSKYLDPRNFP